MRLKPKARRYPTVRRQFLRLGVVAGGVLVLGDARWIGRGPLAAPAQPANRTYRVGLLSSFPLPPDGRAPLVDALEDRLRDFGYVRGLNLTIVQRFPRGWSNHDELQALAAELVAMPLDVIVAARNPAIDA